jgi:LPPG:FO 2-phospho-L-lactate transferase
MLVYLSGGVGGAKLALGFSQLLAADAWSIIVNTGDDIELFGLRVCPDIDTMIYTLAGCVNPVTGWGLTDDTWNCLDQLRLLGQQSWFHLGDRDLATHLWRTTQLRAGRSLSAVTQALARSFGLATPVLPALEEYAPTYVHTSGQALHLQEYFVRERCEPHVEKLEYRNVDKARVGHGVIEALSGADLVVIGPSNPLISIGPILAAPAIRAAIEARRGPVVAVSPIVGGRALKGPTAKMMKELGLDVSAAGVARCYGGLTDLFVLDSVDAAERTEVERLGLKTCVTNTVMATLEDKVRLAGEILALYR